MIETIKHLLFEQLNNNQFFKGGLALGLFSGLAFILKAFFPWLLERIKRQFSHTVCIESKTELYIIFNEWLRNNHSDKYKKVLLSTKEIRKFKDIDDYTVTGYEFIENNFESSFLFWHKKLPVFVTSSREKMESANYIDHLHIESYTLRTYFNRNTLKNLIREILNEYNKNIITKKDSYLFDYKNQNGWSKTSNIGGKTYDKIFNSEKEELLTDLNKFFDSKSLYELRGISFRRGYLLDGSPGNGKTTTILALAQLLKKDVYSLTLSSLSSDDQLRTAFQNIREDSFLLLEDIDCVVNGRDNISDKVNFSTVLNVLDGAFSKSGICTFFTTNHPENLDPALVRCGRIDKKITFNNPCAKDIEDLIELFFGVKEKIHRYKGIYSAAEIQEILIKSNSSSEALVILESKDKINI